ncbi:MAG: YraN family protein [Bacteroidota bacterium]
MQKTPAQATGQLGEEYAVRYLKNLGWTVLERNWRRRKAEIDIIARSGDILVFIEVKTRTSRLFGEPSSFVGPRQIELISAAASAYMESINHDWEIRFDIISILIEETGDYQLEHIEDAFFPGL